MTVSNNMGLRNLSPYSQFGGFESALRSGEPIWVVNNSKPRSLLIMTVNDPLSGKPRTLEFYNTFIPFCLTDMLPRGVLEQSMELRTFMMKGILKIISEEEAHAILGSDRGKKEYERLVTSEFAQGGKTSERSTALEQSTRSAAEQLAASGVTSQVETAAPVHAKLLGWESRCAAGTLEGAALLSELEIYEEEFTQPDCLWILNSQMPQEAKDFASGKLRSGKFAAAPVQAPAAQNARAAAKDYEGDFDVE